MKVLVSLLFLVISMNSFSICHGEQISIEVRISEKTAEVANIQELWPLSGEDEIIIIEHFNNDKVVRFKSGVFEDDGAGNFGVMAIIKHKSSLELFHDHETWYEDGIYGHYISDTGKLIKFEKFICEQSDLFVFL